MFPVDISLQRANVWEPVGPNALLSTWMSTWRKTSESILPALYPCFLYLIHNSFIVRGGPSCPVLGRELSILKPQKISTVLHKSTWCHVDEWNLGLPWEQKYSSCYYKKGPSICSREASYILLILYGGGGSAQKEMLCLKKKNFDQIYKISF